MKTDAEAERILADPGTSKWLYHALRTALQEDLLTVIRDCEFLLNFLGRRRRELENQERS